MDIEKIEQELCRRFQEPLPEFYKRRVIFWHDEEREFADDIGDLHMDIARITDQLNNGQEFEFIFQGKRYSITQGTIDGQFCFSFCEFYKDSVEASTVSELM